MMMPNEAQDNLGAVAAETVSASALYQSETARYPGLRALVEPYCRGYGLDIGFGGDPVNSVAIRMDLPQPYAYTGDLPVQLGGDCRNLRWFRDCALDFVYSSHVLEDFDEHETEPLLREWTRVLQVGGFLVLLLPDQARYVRYCQERGESGNEHHSVADFSLRYVSDAAAHLQNLELVMSRPEIGPYSFLAAFRKTAHREEDNWQQLHQQLEQVWAERDALKLRVREREQALSDANRQAHQLEEEVREFGDRWDRLERNPLIRAVRFVHAVPRSLRRILQKETQPRL